MNADKGFYPSQTSEDYFRRGKQFGSLVGLTAQMAFLAVVYLVIGAWLKCFGKGEQ